MIFDLGSCVACVENVAGTAIAGTGFVMTSDLAVTCAHVVKALGVAVGWRLRLTFHAGGVLEAEVLAEGWYPEADIAFLRLSGPLPEGVTLAPLGASAGCNGHHYLALGYPEDEGRWAQGHIGGLVPVTNWPFRLLQMQGEEIDLGLSGAPVLDQDANYVVGMLRADKTLGNRGARDPKVRFGYAIPAEQMVEKCPKPVALIPPQKVVLGAIQQRYPLLSDYAYDVGKTITAETKWFTGRTFVFEWLETQLRTLPCGYLRLIADAGLGKTAIAAEVARRYNAVIHFINAAAGITRTDQCLNALAVQLIARYGLKHDHLPERAGLDSDFLQTLLQEAAAARDDAPILLVIDALDEVDASTPGHNWLHLPQQLPQGVFILLTHRPGDYPVAVGPQMPQPEPLRINWDDATQQEDIEAHLRRQVGRPELQRALASATPPIAVDTFVQALQGAAEGNFMYLAYVLADIARREPGFDPLDLQALPRGLDGYYKQFWAQMEQVKGQEGWAEWKALYRPVIELLGVAGEPVTAEWLAAHTGREAEEITERALARWVRFLRDERRDGARVWSIIHRSFADFLAGKVNLSAAHRRVARYYLQVWGGWEAGLPNLATTSGLHGGYGMRHLATHLDRALWWEPLRSLFESDAWLHARVAAEDYLYDGYLNDLKIAWRHAEEETRQQIEANAPIDSLAEVVRYALIRTTVNSLAARYEPELVARAVEVGLWTTTRALSVATRIPDAEQRSKLLALLAPHLTGDAHEYTVAEAIAAAHEIIVDWSRAEALIALALQLQGSTRENALLDGLAVAREVVHDQSRVQSLSTLASYLEGETGNQVRAEALAAARGLSNESERTSSLVELAPKLTSDLLTEGLAAVHELSYGSNQVEVLTALAPQLTDDLLPQGLAIAQGIADECSRSEALAAIAPYLPGDLLTQVLAAAQGIADEWYRAQALATLAPYLPANLLTKALAAVQELSDESARVEGLAAMAPLMTGETYDCILAEALAAVAEIKDEWGRTRALITLVPKLIGKTRECVLAESLAMSLDEFGTWLRACALATLAPQLVGEERERVLATALAAAQEETSTFSADILITLAPHLNGDFLAEGLATARQIKNAADRARVLAALAINLSEEERECVLTEALAVTKDISDERVLKETLIEMAPHWVGDTLIEGLVTLRNIPDNEFQAISMTALAPKLTSALLAKVMVTVPEVADKTTQVRTLSALAPWLAEDARECVLLEGLATAQEIVDEGDRVWALRALASQSVENMRANTLEQALVAVRGISGETSRVRALTALAPHLTSNLLAVGITIAREFTDALFRVQALSAMTLQMTGDARECVLAEMLTEAREIERQGTKARVLAALLPQLTGDVRERVMAETLATAREITDGLFRSETLAALVAQLTGDTREQVLTEALEAAREVSDVENRARALTALVPQLTDDTREQALVEALEAAHEIEDKWHRSRALAVLAAQLTGDTREQVLTEALEAARKISDVEDRARALAALVPQLASNRNASVLEALAVAHEISGGLFQAHALAALLRSLSGLETQTVNRSYQTAILEALLTIANRERAEVLRLLACSDTFTPSLLGLSPATVERIAAAVIDICRRWIWV